MELNSWWEGFDEERYWLETTDRWDIGANLNAPQTNEKGNEYWGYSLINEIQPGDVIFHYSKPESAIIGVSVAVGEVWEDITIWAARGTSARSAGTQPHPRPGWYLGLERFRTLTSPVTLDEIRTRGRDIRAMLDRLESRVGAPLYFPFEVSPKRPPRPLQAYVSKLPHGFLNLFPSLLAAATFPPDSAPSSLGTEYRPADEEASIAERDPFGVDPGIVERGWRGHAKTQNALAKHLRSRSISPRSPRSTEPSFDLAWEVDGQRFVAEVKSLTQANEEKQLRLGLGQALRYAHVLSKSGSPVSPVLVVERRPVDASWTELCQAVGVALIWPPTFSGLG